MCLFYYYRTFTCALRLKQDPYQELRHLPLQQQPRELCLQLQGKTPIEIWEGEHKLAETVHEACRLPTLPGLGMASANLLRLVRLSAPNWFKIPGSSSVSCLVSACPVIVKVLAAKEAWTFGLLKWITVPWFVNIFTYSKKKGQWVRQEADLPAIPIPSTMHF